MPPGKEGRPLFCRALLIFLFVYFCFAYEFHKIARIFPTDLRVNYSAFFFFFMNLRLFIYLFGVDVFSIFYRQNYESSYEKIGSPRKAE